MQLPEFYSRVPRITLRDPLAGFLGAATDGILEYGYEDAVKLAGHSCPTVASAWMLGCHALHALYPGELPERGGVRVAFASRFDEGTTGVVASIVTLLTGAAQGGGFKGLAGKYVRRDLLSFSEPLPLNLRFTRLDNGQAVDALADLARIPSDPETPILMGACLRGEADEAMTRRFGLLWQERVKRILIDHGDDPHVFIIRPASPV